VGAAAFVNADAGFLWTHRTGMRAEQDRFRSDYRWQAVGGRW